MRATAATTKLWALSMMRNTRTRAVLPTPRSFCRYCKPRPESTSVDGSVPSSYTLQAHRRISSPLSAGRSRSEEHTSELQSRLHLVCRLLLEKKKKIQITSEYHDHSQCT